MRIAFTHNLQLSDSEEEAEFDRPETVAAISAALRSLGHELEAYSDFCAYRSAELVRRQNRGQPTDISKEDWLKDRRLALQSRMRQLRAAGPELGWTLRGIGI